MTSTVPLSVIVSTYERPRHLRLALEGLRRQAVRDFEVVIADDGSGAETRSVVTDFARTAPFRIEHIWQPDEGFRAARIRNLGVRAARGERLVFLDGDCVPLPDFLAVHAQALGSERVLAGTRMFLDEEPSNRLTEEDVASAALGAMVSTAERARVRWTATKNLLYRHVLRKNRPKVVTANLSLARRTFEAVNGLDERFVGWGFEDDDLRRRLVRRGCRIESVFTRAQVCHLWHSSVESFPGRVRETANVGYFRRGYFLARCRNGLVRRPLEACRIAWNGEGSGGRGVEVAIAWGASPRWVPAEVRVYLAGAALPPAAPHRAHLLLAERSAADAGDAAARNGEAVVAYRGSIDPEASAGRRRILELLEPVI